MRLFKTYIEFILLYEGETHRVKTFEGEYDDLRELINAYVQPPGFGRCDGMGRCATCMVAQQYPNPANNVEINLSCQLSVNDELANKVFSIMPYTL